MQGSDIINITLEKWNEVDYQDFFYASNDKKLWDNMSDTFPKTLEECKTIIHLFATSTEKTEYIRAIKIDNKIVGCIAGFFDTDMYIKNVEISYWLSAEYRGKGIMSQVVKTFSKSLYDSFDLHRIWARPFEHNKSSQRVLQKAGFNYEGLLRESVFKDGVFLNSTVYALIKE